MLKNKILTENLTKTKDLETNFPKNLFQKRVEKVHRIGDIPSSKSLLRLAETKVQESQMKRNKESEEVNGPLDKRLPGLVLSSGFNNDQRKQPSSYDTTMKEIYP